MIRLNCDELYKSYNSYLKEVLDKKEKKPVLATIRVGEDPGSISYEKGLIKHCKDLGIGHKALVFPKGVEKDLLKVQIDKLNRDPMVNGILVFKPLDVDYESEDILQIISPEKDVDGCTLLNKGRLLDLSSMRNLPATAVAIFHFIRSEIEDLTGKNILIINRSHTIGIPLFFLLENANATVTVAHSRSVDIEGLMKDKDLIISAVGRSRVFKPNKLKDGAMVIDMGISQDEGGTFTGDIDYSSLEGSNISYMPSMGGMGKITRTVILENVCENFIGVNNGKR